MSDTENSGHVDEEANLIASIKSSENREDFVSTSLKTDERVIARVTDGIYRQPGSAIRELISNSYDADATRVVINTDAPRFEKIIVEDDGHGMSPEVLAHLILHIGGSSKRNKIGVNLGVTSSQDPTISPGGRKLIGKIGIGLFSVSQLTHSFQIITKVKGDNYRTIATVMMKQYADDDLSIDEKKDEKFESGRVNIWREKAIDVSSHGTTIVLSSIRRQARDTLRSREIWNAIDARGSHFDGEEKNIEPPNFHVGRVNEDGDLLEGDALHSLPWEESDPPEIAFRKFVESVWDESVGRSTPKLENIFDYYLRMMWQISLAIPLPYYNGHLFDMPSNEWANLHILANTPKGKAQPLDGAEGKTIRKIVGLKESNNLFESFDVLFDDVKLARPIKYDDLPPTKNALKKPVVCIGKCREEFPKIPRELSGGALEFEAYLFWTPRVSPVDHQGALIRIHGASGTLFDSTFMRYQVSENTRLRQIVCEIFVKEGLDSALNIDRESFNSAHPHSVFITKWLHSAIRQLTSAQKRISGNIREKERAEVKEERISNIQQVAEDVWRQETDDPGGKPPSIEILAKGERPSSNVESYLYDREVVVPIQQKVRTSKSNAKQEVQDEKLKAIAQVLAAYGVLDGLTKSKQENLLRTIYQILDAPSE